MNLLRTAGPQQAGVAALWLLPVGLSVGVAGTAPTVVMVAGMLALIPFSSVRPEGGSGVVLRRYIQVGLIAAVLAGAGPVGAFIGGVGALLAMTGGRVLWLSMGALSALMVVMGAVVVGLGGAWNRLQPYWSEPDGWLLPSVALGVLAGSGLRPTARWVGAPWVAAGAATLVAVGSTAVVANAWGHAVDSSVLTGLTLGLLLPLAYAAADGTHRGPRVAGVAVGVLGTLVFLLGGEQVSTFFWRADLPLLVAALLACRCVGRSTLPWGAMAVALVVGTVLTLPPLPDHPAAAVGGVLPLLGGVYVLLARREAP